MKRYIKTASEKKNRGQTEKVWDAKTAAQQVATAMQNNIDDGIMDFEFEIDKALDNDRFWSVLDSIVKSIGISYSVKSSDKEFDDHYYYCYLYGDSRKIESASSVDYQKAYNAAKQRILDCIASETQKTTQILRSMPISSALADKSLSWDERERLIHGILGDAEILDALHDAGVIGHIDYDHNRYGQWVGGAKFRKTFSKRGKSGWSAG